MKKIKMTGRETLIMTRDEIYSLPNNIADQILRRGHCVLIEEEEETPKKKIAKKE
jgi:hypothetical protein